MVIDHYFKWNEAKTVPNHGPKTIAKFLEDESFANVAFPNSYSLTTKENG
jgi:hypothetical protein